MLKIIWHMFIFLKKTNPKVTPFCYSTVFISTLLYSPLHNAWHTAGIQPSVEIIHYQLSASIWGMASWEEKQVGYWLQMYTRVWTKCSTLHPSTKTGVGDKEFGHFLTEDGRNRRNLTGPRGATLVHGTFLSRKKANQPDSAPLEHVGAFSNGKGQPGITAAGWQKGPGFPNRKHHLWKQYIIPKIFINPSIFLEGVSSRSHRKKG